MWGEPYGQYRYRLVNASTDETIRVGDVMNHESTTRELAAMVITTNDEYREHGAITCLIEHSVRGDWKEVARRSWSFPACEKIDLARYRVSGARGHYSTMQEDDVSELVTVFHHPCHDGDDSEFEPIDDAVLDDQVPDEILRHHFLSTEWDTVFHGMT